MPKCLIVDDSNVIRMLLSKIMGNFGYEVLEAEDGEEVLKIFDSEYPELIILDWYLPRMSGIDALIRLRSIKDIKRPYVIFCTSVVDVIKMREALMAGADDYIMKPFDEEIIASKLSILGLI